LRFSQLAVKGLRLLPTHGQTVSEDGCTSQQQNGVTMCLDKAQWCGSITLVKNTGVENHSNNDHTEILEFIA
jgi:hypothetical protein